jgi:EF-P beta-lysylation protein EpmB
MNKPQQVFPDSVESQQPSNWKEALSEAFRDPGELLKYCGINKPADWSGQDGGFAFRVTRYYASLIQKGDASDPLLLQVLPDSRESQLVNGYSKDAVGDARFMSVPGLIHKYRGRVLLTLTGACAIHCRYCFRRHFPYSDAGIDYTPDGAVMRYLAEDREISEVILSGGDPLMVSDDKLAALITNLNHIPHIRTLRFHSRLLSVLPERVNESFVAALQRFRGQVVFVTHINHPNEISAPNQAAFHLLAHRGFRIFNQSVLLKGVNDSTDTLIELSHKLFDSQITPYYLHCLDKVQGAAHFDLPLPRAREIYSKLRSALPGYLLPAMVREIEGESSKTPVIQE